MKTLDECLDEIERCSAAIKNENVDFKTIVDECEQILNERDETKITKKLLSTLEMNIRNIMTSRAKMLAAINDLGGYYHMNGFGRNDPVTQFEAFKNDMENNIGYVTVIAGVILDQLVEVKTTLFGLDSNDGQNSEMTV